MKTGKTCSITKLISGNMLYLKGSTKRVAYTWYKVCIPAGAVKDSAGNNCAVYSFTFKTGLY